MLYVSCNPKAIFVCAFVGMWCVYSKNKRFLCACIRRGHGVSSSPIPASARRHGGASSPTSMLPRKLNHTSSANDEKKGDTVSVYSHETIQTPPSIHRPQPRCPSYDPHAPAVPASLPPTRKHRAPVPRDWPIAFKLEGGRPLTCDNIHPVAGLSSKRSFLRHSRNSH